MSYKYLDEDELNTPPKPRFTSSDRTPVDSQKNPAARLDFSEAATPGAFAATPSERTPMRPLTLSQLSPMKRTLDFGETVTASSPSTISSGDPGSMYSTKRFRESTSSLVPRLEPHERLVHILFPLAPMRPKDILVLDQGLPCSANGWARDTNMVTKVFLDNVRRNRPNAAREEMDKIDLAKNTFDRDGKVTKLSPLFLCKMTELEEREHKASGDFALVAPCDLDRVPQSFADKYLLQTPKVGKSLQSMIDSNRLHCHTAVNMILTRLIPFAENLFDCNVASNMLHNDVTLLNVCYSQKDDKLYLIDFELLKPAGSKPLNSDIVSIIRNIVSELVPLMTYGQQVFFRQVKDIPTSALTIDVVKSILQGLVELDE